MIAATADVGPLSVVRQVGSGEFATSEGRYPFGVLRYTRFSSGRGMVGLEAGAGRVLLSGKDADRIGPATWRLKIDTMVVLSAHHVSGWCDLETAPEHHTYVSMGCRLQSRDDKHMALSWSGDGSPYQHRP